MCDKIREMKVGIKLVCRLAPVSSLQKCVTYDPGTETVFSLQNVIPAGIIDRNRNLFCTDFSITITYRGPEDGFFSFILYFQTRKEGEKWSEEWELLSVSPIFGAKDLVSVGYDGCFPEKTLEQCEIRFLMEMYDRSNDKNEFADMFITNTDYWISLMESDHYDNIMSP